MVKLIKRLNRVLLPDTRRGTAAIEDFAFSVAKLVKESGKDANNVPWDTLFYLYKDHKDSEIEKILSSL